ncbi:MAG: hypothetical protein M5U09_24285 [Gammaproteobacteria bacterium]|nr:hypothetical protein [Gammaproteobacteria bacterium]
MDGTKSFVSGKPTYGSLVALVHDSTPVLGVIGSPAGRALARRRRAADPSSTASPAGCPPPTGSMPR